MNQFTLLPTVHKGSLFSTSSPTFVIYNFFFDDRHPKRYEVISHYIFPDDFYFPDDY